MMHAVEVGRRLGGRRVLGRSPRTDRDFVELVRRGLPVQCLRSAARSVDLTEEDARRCLGLARRTLARRKALRQRLSTDESERVVRLARVAALARDVLADDVKATRWLRSPSRALGGAPPLALLDTEIGTGAVIDELQRIEYGVFA